MTRLRPIASSLAALALLLTGCAAGPPGPEALGCTNDSDCPDQMVCFVDGCGDPGTNIVVEVRPSDGAEQDYLVDGGTLRPIQNFELFPTSQIVGSVQRKLADGGTEPYATGVSVSARGTSLYIPGVTRWAGPVTPDENGVFRLPIGSGQFTATASTADPGVPPISQPYVFVYPASQLNLNLIMPAPDALVRLDGQVLHTADGEAVTAPLQIEAIDPATRRPLSHRIPVTDGGTFSLTALQPAYGDLMVLRVSSGEANGLVPQKEFTVLSVGALPPLELGNYGDPVTVTGRVLDPDGGVVSGAAVVLSGPVAGGGEFRSPVATTLKDGSFSLVTLPSTPAGMRLLVVPPVPGIAGVLEQAGVIVGPAGADLEELACPARVLIKGLLLRPDGVPASGVLVTAEPKAKVGTAEHAGQAVETRTLADGAFELRLDPAVYQLNFSPGEILPRASRMVTVPALGPAPSPLVLDPITLSSGRTLRGRILMKPSASEAAVPAPNATIRFFRVVTTDGVPGGIVMAQGISDYLGNYQVVLPTRTP